MLGMQVWAMIGWLAMVASCLARTRHHTNSLAAHIEVSASLVRKMAGSCSPAAATPSSCSPDAVTLRLARAQAGTSTLAAASLPWMARRRWSW